VTSLRTRADSKNLQVRTNVFTVVSGEGTLVDQQLLVANCSYQVMMMIVEDTKRESIPSPNHLAR
jgi:hypothetical protein